MPKAHKDLQWKDLGDTVQGTMQVALSLRDSEEVDKESGQKSVNTYLNIELRESSTPKKSSGSSCALFLGDSEEPYCEVPLPHEWRPSQYHEPRREVMYMLSPT